MYMLPVKGYFERPETALWAAGTGNNVDATMLLKVTLKGQRLRYGQLVHVKMYMLLC